MPDAPPAPAVGSARTEGEAAPTQSRSDGQHEGAPVMQSGVAATLCTRGDGSQYLSENGRGNRRAVPLGMTGYPGSSLADAYAGPNGIGVSAPGLGAAPSGRSYPGQIGGAYVWVEDPCEQINSAQLCGFLSGRIADTERRLRFAFSDTSKKVQHELESLRQRARQCPR